MARAEPVHAHDDGLAGIVRKVAKEFRQVRARLALHRPVDRVLEVEGQCVGFAFHRLGEELRPRGGNEKLASHPIRRTIASVNSFVLALPFKSPVRMLSTRSTWSIAARRRVALSARPA